MSIIAEKLVLSMSYKRGVSNDQRTCVDFLKLLIPEAKTSLKLKQNGSYSIHSSAIDKMEHAQRLILAYGNPASHGREVVPDEVTQLITACENALNSFRCPECSDYVWMADQSSRERLQCPCGKVRWQYG
jgi:ribosomal protein S27AE